MKYVSYTTQALLFGLLTLLSVACGKLPGFVVQAKTDSFKQEAVINDKIDILFVVDNSGSMGDEQTNLGNSFSAFIENFTERDLNFQIGVTTTDHTVTASWWACTAPYNTSGNCPYWGIKNAGPGSLVYKTGNDKILTKNSTNLVQQFAQNVSLGVKGGGNEAGILAMIKFLDTPLQTSWNADFVREGALLAVVFVSDEDETRVTTPNVGHYIRRVEADKNARLNEFYTAIETIKNGKKDLIASHAVVAPTVAQCPTVGTDTGWISGTGDVYIEAAQHYSGEEAYSNICADFSAAIEKLGEDLVKLLTKFKLVQIPEGQIEIRVNGVLVPRDPVNGWEYLAETNEVEFRGTAIPSANAQISVSYVPGAPLPIDTG